MTINPDLRMRVGKFRISDSEFELGLPEISRIFAVTFPVRVEGLIGTREIEVISLSFMFERIEHGMRIPEYDISFDENNTMHVDRIEGT